MRDWLEIENRVHQMIKDNRLTQAEAFLLESYGELRGTEQVGDLDYVVGALAQFYSMPEVEDRSKAEKFFLEREGLSPEAEPKLQTATFYFYVLRDFSKTVDKVDEIGVRTESRASASYYSGLSLKRQALLELNRIAQQAEYLTKCKL